MDYEHLYGSGKSLTDVSKETGIPISTLRYRLYQAGLLRSPEEARKIAVQNGKYTKRDPSNKGRVFSDRARSNMKKAAIKRGENAKGVSLKPSGYIEYTKGEHKGRSVHVVAMEEKIGRRILPDEIVHHVDGDRSNNHISNLALMTRSAHSRLHRLEEIAGNIQRERNNYGRFI